MLARASAFIKQRPWFSLAAIIALGALLRFWNLGEPSLWADEIASVSFGRVPADLLWSDWMVYETNPPLYYALLNGWMDVFGEGEFAVRAMSVVFGLAAIAAVFVLTRALHSTLAGLCAAIFCALSAAQLGQSQEARGYILGFLAATLAGYALIRIADAWGARAHRVRELWQPYAIYAASTTIALYTHTTFFILPLLANIFIVWLWLFATPRRFSDALGWIGANLVVLALWAWWAWITVLQIQTGAETVSWIPKPSIVDAVAIISHIVATRSFEIANVLIAGAFGAVMAWGWWKLPLERRVFALVFGAGVPLVLLGISLVRPIFLERTLFWVQFIYLAMLAVGVATLPWSRWRVAVAAAIALVLVADSFNWLRITYREPWREVAEILREQAGPRDMVLTSSAISAVNFDYYCREDGCGGVEILAQASERGRRGIGQFYEGPELTAQNAAAIVGRYERVWVIARTVDDATPIVEPLASREGEERLGDETGRMRLTVWRPNAAQ
ncbi:MAG: glycosyltransferase family 39 protein [Hyphomonadaceae bacterium]|nr:glycosyltransferase family 39 protein [Hyphomonadaceae bacterium]